MINNYEYAKSMCNLSENVVRQNKLYYLLRVYKSCKYLPKFKYGERHCLRLDTFYSRTMRFVTRKPSCELINPFYPFSVPFILCGCHSVLSQGEGVSTDLFFSVSNLPAEI